ncbi:MAG TPA: hypothetical protein VJ950_09415 [Acidimicrobiia bacterium]|nr:hypothetical protein [Acidimicrobiia bacterium]
MELNRLLKVFKSRWPIIGLIAAVGFASAFGLTALSGGAAQPVFEATTAVQFTLEEEETVENLTNEIEAELGIALFAAQDLLAEDLDSRILSNPDSARLVFVSRGASAEEAMSRVRELVDAYLEADPSSGGDVSGKLAELEGRAAEIQAEIEALTPVLTPAERALVDQHSLLDLKIARVQESILALTVADAGASQDERSENADAIADLEAELAELNAEKAGLPPAPSEELGAVDQFRFDSLVRLLDVLELEYQQYAMRLLGITGSGGTLQAPSVADLTPEPPNPLSNGAVGFLGGAAIALLALVLTTRARKEVWLPSDLPLPLLGVVPKRRSPGFQGSTWYDAAEGGVRKSAIQALRGAVEGALDRPGAVVAVLGDRVDTLEVHSIAADLAAAFASAGQSVLLIDADFSDRTELREFSVGEPTLESFLRLPAVSKSHGDRVTQLLDAAIHIRPGLAVIPSGEQPTTPADALAAPQFRSLLDHAERMFDLVILVAGTAGSPSAGVVAQRAGEAMVAVTPGRTTVTGLESLITELHTQRVHAIGAVMVTGTERGGGIARLPLPAWATSSEAVRSAPVGPADPLERLRFYPFPMEKGSNPVRDGSLRTLVGDLSEGGSGLDHEWDTSVNGRDHLASELLAALANDTSGGREAVGGYLVARVEDLLTAVSGQENLSSDLINVVRADAYLPLTPVRGHRTVGDWLVDELGRELGADEGARVASEFARVLGKEGSGDASRMLDLWLAEEFFPRHIERSHGEPDVWHLASEGRTVELLVYGRRLDRERLDRIINDLVLRLIDELQRRVEEAQKEDRDQAVDRLEAGLRDLYLFEVGLRMLQVGSSDEARLHYPWRRSDQQPKGWAPIWTEGIRPNVAPLQRLGLLAYPVLDEGELVATQSAV